MGLESVHLAITTWFATAFAAAMTLRSLTVPVVWPGDKRTSLPADQAPWVRFSFQPVLARTWDVGTYPSTLGTIEDIEQVVIEILVKDGDGWILLDKLTDDVRRLFVTVGFTPASVGGAQFNDIGLRAPRIVARDSDRAGGPLLKAIVVAPYRIEHTP